MGPQKDTGASRLSSIVNLTNTIIGAGLLAMPYAMKANGICLGCLVLLISGLASATGLYLQAVSAGFVKSRTASFARISRLTYPSLSVLFDMAIALKSFGVGASYMMIAGDLMDDVWVFLTGAHQRTSVARNLCILVCFVIAGPLAAFRKLDSLKYTSFIALVAVAYLTALVSSVFLLGDSSSIDKGPVRVQPVSVWSTLSSLPILVFGFTCHHNVSALMLDSPDSQMYSILNDLKDTSHRSIVTVICTSVGAAFVLYLSVGIVGYLTYGDNVGGNIVSMYEQNWPSVIGRLAIVASVLLSYPLQVHPCRSSLNNVYNCLTKPGSMSFGDPDSANPSLPLLGGHVSESPLTTKRHWILTCGIVLASYATVTSVDSLQVMLAFVGSTGSTAISSILPGVFVYSLLNSDLLPQNPNVYDYLDSPSKIILLRRLSVILVGWGIFIFLACSITNLWLYT